MSVYCVVNARQKLHDTTRKIFLNEPLMYSNAQAHCFRLTLMADNGTDPADLTGVTATANFLRPDRSTVALDGTISGNVVEVVLPNACYSSVGRYKLTVDIGEGTGSSAATRTALIVEGITERNVTDTYVDPGTIMPSINTLIADINDAIDSIPTDYSTLLDSIAQTFSDTADYKAGDFVWRGDLADGGKLYRFTQDHAAGAWTGTDAVEAVVTDGVEGDVRYDAAQTLTESQKVMARANIGGASNDLLTAVGNLVDYGATPVEGYTTREGVTVVRTGTHLALNGTNSGESMRYRMYGTLSGNTGTRQGASPTAEQNVTGGAKVKAGHTYRLCGRLLSGTYTAPVMDSNPNWRLNAYYQGTTTAWSSTVLVRDGINHVEICTVETDGEVCVWFANVPSGAFTNATVEVWMEDITEAAPRYVRVDPQSLTDGQAGQARGNIGAVSTGYHNAMNGLVEYGARPELQTTTSNGADYTVIGNRFTANGTNTGNPTRVRLYAKLIADAGSISTANNIAGGPTLKAGRTYRVYCRLVSGTYTSAGTANWTINVFKPSTSTLLGTTVVRNADLNILEITPTEDVAACTWFAAINGDAYTNCVFYVWLVDETARSSVSPDALAQYSIEENEAWGE